VPCWLNYYSRCHAPNSGYLASARGQKIIPVRSTKSRVALHTSVGVGWTGGAWDNDAVIKRLPASLPSSWMSGFRKADRGAALRVGRAAVECIYACMWIVCKTVLLPTNALPENTTLLGGDRIKAKIPDVQ